MSLPIEIKQVSGKEIENYIDDLAQLRIKVFYEWPYLYEGDIEYEKKYLSTYRDNSDSFIAIALHQDKVIGAATAVRLSSADEAFRKPMEKAGHALSQWVYFGESVLMHEYRGHGIGHRFFDARENWAKSLNAKGCCFCAVIRPDNHPLRPAHARDLKPFWRGRGYSPVPNINVQYSWLDREQESEDTKSMQVWIKQFH